MSHSRNFGKEESSDCTIRYRTITPKARLVPLTQSFVDYLRADGIILPDEDEQTLSDDDSGIFSSTDDQDDDGEDEDVSARWRDVHDNIKATIAELGGKVVPKLNWSAPKDATWISATNSLECRTPNDIYLLLKSSDFVTHDLEHAFDDCDPDGEQESNDVAEDIKNIPYVLALRKWVQLNPSVEFRCFVRRRQLVGICQRDLNHFDFLFKMREDLRDLIQEFFDKKVRDSFPDESFTFDVYIPPPHNKVWIVDFNPWAIRTDPLLFSWLDLLTMKDPKKAPTMEDVVRLPLNGHAASGSDGDAIAEDEEEEDDDERESDEDEEADEDYTFGPEFKLVKRDDPEAYMFNSTRYSAHKLPKDVVDASQSGAGGLREFADNWKDILARRQQEDREAGSEED